MRFVMLEQKAQGICLIFQVDPRHGLAAMTKRPTKEETWSKCHQWKQTATSSEDHCISKYHAADTQLFNRLSRILPWDSQLSEKIVGRRRRLIGQAFATQAITVDTRSLKENLRAM